MLEAMGLDAKTIDGAVRVSLCRDNTREELVQLAEALQYAKTILKG